MRQHLLLATSLGLLVAASLGNAQEDNRAAVAQQRIEEIRSRLQLSDEQIEQLAPVFQESMAAQQEILSKYGIDLASGSRPEKRLGMREARAMRQEMEPVRAEMMDAAEEILNPEQFEEFERIQEERRAEMRERIRGGR